jgi:2-oxoglutarate dehydrogenase E2 component (dihydrolipoamide succinyltransferase)
MAQIEIKLPKMGESVTEATITNWLKEVGDHIALDEPLVEVATDKVDNELPSEAEGILIKKMFDKDQVAQVGDVIAVISTGGIEEKIDIVQQEVVTIVNEVVQAPVMETPALSSESNSKFLSPLVRSIADKEGVSNTELDAIIGTGQEGRVTKKDMIAYIETKKNTPIINTPIINTPVIPITKEAPVNIIPNQTENVQKTAPVIHKEIVVIPSAGDEIIEMDRMRKLIAEHMVMSKQTSPHVTSFVEADVTNVVRWRDRVKSTFEKRENEKLTFTPIFIEAVAKAIKDFPMINVSVNGHQIIVKKDINIGMATALPSGNLIVPVIKRANLLNMVGLSKSVNDLANRARQNKLQPDEVRDGTFTLTNLGSFGNIMGTPIINQPQVAILAVGAIKKKPAVLETPDGDVIAIRHMMFLSLSYDHRVVDGGLGGSFVRRVADYLEAWDVNREA